MYTRARKVVKKTPKKNESDVKKLTRMVRSMRPEVKEIRYPYTNVAGTGYGSISFGSGTTMALLADGITNGSADGQRIGHRIKITGIQVYFAIQGATVDNFNNLRFMLVRPKTERNSVGGTLISSILSGAPSSGVQWASPVDTSRYTVYFDETFNFFNRVIDAAGNVVSETKFLKKYVRLNSIVQWDDSNLCLRDFILVGISDSGTVSNPGVIAGHVVVHYTDA